LACTKGIATVTDAPNSVAQKLLDFTRLLTSQSAESILASTPAELVELLGDAFQTERGTIDRSSNPSGYLVDAQGKPLESSATDDGRNPEPSQEVWIEVSDAFLNFVPIVGERERCQFRNFRHIITIAIRNEEIKKHPENPFPMMVWFPDVIHVMTKHKKKLDPNQWAGTPQ
jgi:hypothetical protein